MKKSILFLTCATMLAGPVSAQSVSVNDALKLSSNSSIGELSEAVKSLKSTATTSKDVLTYYATGKVAFALYDKYYGMSQINQPIDTMAMSNALLDGFKFYEEGLPLDSMPQLDKNGQPKVDKHGVPKIKPKYSKDMLQTMVNHAIDVVKVADILRDAQKWTEAGIAYEKYCNIVKSPLAAQNNISIADSTFGMVRFLEGFCQYFGQDYTSATKNLIASYGLGYRENNIEGFLDASLVQVIQKDLDTKNYANAYQLLDHIISKIPQHAFFYDLKGQVMSSDSTKKADEYLVVYKKAVEIDPNNASALYHVGSAICDQAQEIINADQNATNAQLAPKVIPFYNEAVPYLEKAIANDKDNQIANSAKSMLDSVKYRLDLLKQSQEKRN